MEEQKKYDPVDKYQQILDDAQDMRRKGAINSSELASLSLIIRGLFTLGMDIATDIGSLRDNGVSDTPDGGEGETEEMDSALEGNSGEESAVRPAVSKS